MVHRRPDCAQRRGDVALDNLASEIVERIFAIPPSGIVAACDFSASQSAPPPLPITTIDRAIGSIATRAKFFDRRVVALRGRRRHQVQSAGRGGRRDRIEDRIHAIRFITLRIARSFASVLDDCSAARDETDQKQDQENKEENLRDTDGGPGDATEAENIPR